MMSFCSQKAIFLGFYRILNQVMLLLEYAGTVDLLSSWQTSFDQTFFFDTKLYILFFGKTFIWQNFIWQTPFGEVSFGKLYLTKLFFFD